MTRGRGRGRGGSTRGRGQRDVPSSPARLPHKELPITYIEGGMLMPAHQVSACMTKIFKKNIHENGICWKQVPEYRKLQYFEKFKEYYRWDKAIDKLVEVAFMKKAKKRYGDMVCTFKKKRDLGKPECVPPAAWQSWLKQWDKPESIAKSRQASRNRMSEVAGPGTGCSRHTGGSRSTIEHSHVLREELDHDPNPYECFLHTHKKKDGSFVDERSRLIAEDVEARVAAATQRAEERGEPLEIDMTQVYLDAVGGVEKDRVYGIGSLAYILYRTALKASRAASTQFDEAAFRKQVAEEMQQHFNEKMEERDARVRRQLQEEMAEMEARMTHIIEDLRRNGHLPPA
ncbi:hypothetical protein CASFOL_010146 [Castilleja foliolosa]|uniref:Transposase n=1 Tax=Castilleja foliolosa TaxID=1961234 RepID=A0ABD3DVW8_9LAMI